MDKATKQEEAKLEDTNHEIKNDKCYITAASNRKEVICSVCGRLSSRIHSTYNRTLQDLPIKGYKVFITRRKRKMFCENVD